MHRFLKICFVGALMLLGGLAGWALGKVYVATQYEAIVKYARLPLWLPQFLAALFGALVAFLFSVHAFNTLAGFAESLEKMPARDKIAALTGVLLGILFTAVTALIFGSALRAMPAAALAITLLSGYVFCYLGVVAMMGMKRELFSMLPGTTDSMEDAKPQKCKILDTNVIIDGRIADVCRSGFVEGTIYVPGFVLDELQHIADSGDALKRARGRRGLDILHQMQKEMRLVVRHFDAVEGEGDQVDLKLVQLAKQLDGAIITNDYNLNKVAELQGVQVLNINELANALKPVVLPGEELTVTIIKEGREPNQGIAYLDDGTMVVVENAKKYINSTIDVVVSSVLQTIAGKMIFADVKVDRDEAEEVFGRTLRTYTSGRPRRKGP
ncbi:MAG: PIN/TRAM domain-containing protein [Armatimonadota bacterium]